MISVSAYGIGVTKRVVAIIKSLAEKNATEMVGLRMEVSEFFVFLVFLDYLKRGKPQYPKQRSHQQRHTTTTTSPRFLSIATSQRGEQDTNAEDARRFQVVGTARGGGGDAAEVANVGQDREEEVRREAGDDEVGQGGGDGYDHRNAAPVNLKPPRKHAGVRRQRAQKEAESQRQKRVVEVLQVDARNQQPGGWWFGV